MTKLDDLAEEIRNELVETVSKTGGHLASNLGIVELTIAMHLVFDSPRDQFVWDVGHQVYTHKLLTGRYKDFGTLRQNGGLSGFPNPEESAHDIFAAGHSGTSISAAYGLSVAKTISGNNSHTVAVIGDGSCTGGLVYEALNNAGHSNTNLIVILNDNDMSISDSVGALATYLAKIRTNPVYYRAKRTAKEVLKYMPRGEQFYDLVDDGLKTVKNKLYRSNFFEDLGFQYMGPLDGHNIHELVLGLQAAKEFNTPVLLHIKTVKGKGYYHAEHNPDVFHGISKFNVATGQPLSSSVTYSDIFGEKMCEIAERNQNVCGLTAAMALGTGMTEFAKRFPDRFFDVGIAEEHAVTFSGGLAAGGKIPVFAVYSTFLQRAYDEVVHDVAMQNKKVVLGIDRAGFVGEDGRSHNGLLDIAFLRSIPGAVIYSPSSFDELRLNLDMAVDEGDGVTAVRYPRGGEGYVPDKFVPSSEPYSVYGKKTAPVAIVTFGSLYGEAEKAREALRAYDIDVKIVKLNRVWPIDDGAVVAAMKADTILFYEEGIKSGGVGEAYGSRLMEMKYTGDYAHIAVDNTFVHHASVAYLREEFGMSADEMVKEILRRV